MLDASKSNFSAWRGTIDQARIRIRQISSEFITQMNAPVWDWRTRYLIQTNPIIRRMAEGNPNILRNRWRVPGFRYIQPEQEAKAHKLQLDSFISSPRRIQSDLGRDWDEVYVEIIQDRAAMVRGAAMAAKELQDDLGIDVSWRDILSPSLGGNSVTQSVVNSAQADASDQGDADGN